MKKKSFALLLSLIAVLALYACGKTGGSTPDPVTNGTSGTAVADQGTSGTAVTPAADQGTSSAAVTSAPDQSTNMPEATPTPVPEKYDEIKLNPIYRYYRNYLVMGTLDYDGYFNSPDGKGLICSPILAFADVNGDDIKDIIVTGDLGIRNKKLTVVYYYDDTQGAFFEVGFYGHPYAVSNGCVMVDDEDNEGMYKEFSEITVYKFVAEETDALCKYLKVSEYTEDGKEAEVMETYSIKGESVNADAYNAEFKPFEYSKVELSYSVLTDELIDQMFGYLD